MPRKTKKPKILYSIFFLALILSCLIAIGLFFKSRTPININEVSSGSTQPVALDITNDFGAYMEIPIYVLTSGYKQLNLTTNFGYGCATPKNILTDKIVLHQSDCVPTIKANTLTYSPENIPSNQDWKRNYDGIFSMHAIQKDNKLTLLSFDHGENKNENLGGKLYQNTVYPALKVQDCASGYVNGVYKDCWESYNAFVNVSWQYLDSAHAFGMKDRIEEGPIVWPQSGYFQNGVRKSYGLRHPCGIVSSDYLYVFYSDASLTDSGIKVARAPVSSGGKSGSFKSNCKGNWVPSLPSGFDKSNMVNFYSKQGGCATSVVPTEGSLISFSVAEQSTGGFLGVAEESNGIGPTATKLYKSTDLVNWTYLKTAYQTDNYATNVLHYPIFLNQQGTSSSRLNPNSFYILGASEGKTYALKFSLNETGPVSPSSTPTLTMTTGATQIYNLYYEPSDRRMFTTNEDEKNMALGGGWKQTSSFKAWKTPTSGLVPVYRLRNQATNQYTYSASDNERTIYEQQGWGSEGVSFYAYNFQIAGSIPVYKLKNTQTVTKYIYTISTTEKQTAMSSGYLDEGIVFYVSP